MKNKKNKIKFLNNNKRVKSINKDLFSVDFNESPIVNGKNKFAYDEDKDPIAFLKVTPMEERMPVKKTMNEDGLGLYIKDPKFGCMEVKPISYAAEAICEYPEAGIGADDKIFGFAANEVGMPLVVDFESSSAMYVDRPMLLGTKEYVSGIFIPMNGDDRLLDPCLERLEEISVETKMNNLVEDLKNGKI